MPFPKWRWERAGPGRRRGRERRLAQTWTHSLVSDQKGYKDKSVRRPRSMDKQRHNKKRTAEGGVRLKGPGRATVRLFFHSFTQNTFLLRPKVLLQRGQAAIDMHIPSTGCERETYRNERQKEQPAPAGRRLGVKRLHRPVTCALLRLAGGGITATGVVRSRRFKPTSGGGKRQRARPAHAARPPSSKSVGPRLRSRPFFLLVLFAVCAYRGRGWVRLVSGQAQTRVFTVYNDSRSGWRENDGARSKMEKG